MKQTMFIVGYFISFLTGYYLHDFVTIDGDDYTIPFEQGMTLEVAKDSEADINMTLPMPVWQFGHSGVGDLEFTTDPNIVPFEQGMTLMPGQTARVEMKDMQVFSGFEQLYAQYRAGWLDREDMEYFFGDSVWVKIEELEK